MISHCRLVSRPFRRRPAARRFEALERRDMLSTNVLNYRYDASSSGVDSQETTLTPANVNAGSFGKLASTPVDGQIYAQPLYVENVQIDGGTHNVVYVATEHDSVYAIDSGNGDILWHDSFLAPGITSVPSADTGSPALQPELGITATPVIDPNTNSIYVLANTKEVRADGTHYVYKLHALNLATGAENLGGPLTIADTIYDGGSNYTFVSGPTVNGTGAGSVDGKITFNALRELGRVALTEVDGNIYMAFASHPDIPPAHGWVLAVNARTLSLWGAVNDTPNGEFGDIWEAGDSITVDSEGNLYVATGNGTSIGVIDNNRIGESDWGFRDGHNPTIWRSTQMADTGDLTGSPLGDIWDTILGRKGRGAGGEDIPPREPGSDEDCDRLHDADICACNDVASPSAR
ncbi:MAG TPA: hypothetical protein PK867_15885, partial [Pirellulales bacterium]|nr:hypothetical protein [Pirellulales bacterium]